MKYYSTRDTAVSLSAAQAVKQGLSRDGGLLTPETFPALTQEDLTAMLPMTYQERAARIMGLYLEDYSADELAEFARRAYGPDRFDTRAEPR